MQIGDRTWINLKSGHSCKIEYDRKSLILPEIKESGYTWSFWGEITATIFNLKTGYEEKTQRLFPCQRSGYSAAGLNFEI